MRIVGGAWRGRILSAPAGSGTRPTADRLRQTLFDILLHAPWGGRALLDGARVLDAFAGTGALGLEGLSRGAATAVFIERDRAALAVLRANIAACRAEARCTVLNADATAPPRAQATCDVAFLDPPYGQGQARPAVAALASAGWLSERSVVVAELARDDPSPAIGVVLDERCHGVTKLVFFNPPN